MSHSISTARQRLIAAKLGLWKTPTRVIHRNLKETPLAFQPSVRYTKAIGRKARPLAGNCFRRAQRLDRSWYDFAGYERPDFCHCPKTELPAELFRPFLAHAAEPYDRRDRARGKRR